MQVAVYSLKQTLFSGQAELVNCNTALGEITVLDHHRPLIAQLKDGTVKIVDDKKEETYFEVAGGFLKVGTHNDVLMVVDE